MATTPETNYFAPRGDIEPQDGKENILPPDPEVVKETEAVKAEIGTIVTVEFLDTKTTTEFLITREEREREELSPELQAQLPPGVKLARATTPLARAVMGRIVDGKTLEFIVQRTRPLKIVEIKALTT